MLERCPPLSPPGVATALATAVVSKPQTSSSRFSPSSADALQYPPQRSLNRILLDLADPLPPLLPLSELLSELHRPLLLAAAFFQFTIRSSLRWSTAYLTSNGTVVLYDHLCSCALAVFRIVKHDSLVARRKFPAQQWRSAIRGSHSRPSRFWKSLLQGSALWIRSNLRPSLVTSRNLSNDLLAGTIYLCNSVKSLELLLCINASLFERQTVTHCLRIESLHENIHNDFFLKNQSPRPVIICLQSYKL